MAPHFSWPREGARSGAEPRRRCGNPAESLRSCTRTRINARTQRGGWHLENFRLWGKLLFLVIHLGGLTRFMNQNARRFLRRGPPAQFLALCSIYRPPVPTALPPPRFVRTAGVWGRGAGGGASFSRSSAAPALGAAHPRLRRAPRSHRRSPRECVWTYIHTHMCVCVNVHTHVCACVFVCLAADRDPAALAVFLRYQFFFIKPQMI